MSSKDVVRRMMDQGATVEAIAGTLGLSPRTIENYRYDVRRPGEVIKPNGRPHRPTQPLNGVKVEARMIFTPEQLRRIRDNAARFNCSRPAILMERLLAVIADDNLFDAILGDADAD